MSFIYVKTAFEIIKYVVKLNMNSVKSSALKVNNRVILERLLKVGLKFKYNKRHEIHHRVERLFQPLTVAPRGSVHHKNDDTSNSHKVN